MTPDPQSTNPEHGSVMANDMTHEARPFSEYHEDMGPVLWWKFPVEEPPYVGSPLDLGRGMKISINLVGEHEEMTVNIGGWPGYHTHWTPIDMPAPPRPPLAAADPDLLAAAIAAAKGERG